MTRNIDDFLTDPEHAAIDHTGIPGVGGAPVGTVFDFAGAVAPSGFLLCDGTSYATASFPDLFAVIGYTWGGGGANFNVPDLRRRATVGSGGASSGTLGNAVGNVGGTETTTPANSGDHQHLEQTNTHNHPLTSTVVQSGAGATVATFGSGFTGLNPQSSFTSAAGNHNHGALNIIQPSAVMLKIIKT